MILFVIFVNFVVFVVKNPVTYNLKL